MNPLYAIASTAAESDKAGLFDSLGIDLKMLILQSIAFLALLFVLSKYVFPVLTKMIDDRERTIEEGQKAAAAAVKAAESAQQDTARQLAEAQKAAASILEVAHKEASQVMEEAETRAGKRAEHLIAQAENRLAQDIQQARVELRKEMLHLVTEATGTVLGEKVTSETDKKLIARAVKEAK